MNAYVIVHYQGYDGQDNLDVALDLDSALEAMERFGRARDYALSTNDNYPGGKVMVGMGLGHQVHLEEFEVYGGDQW